MKIIIKLLVFILVYGNVNAQKIGFELKGGIEGLRDGSMVYLTSPSRDTLSRTVSKGSKFTLTGYIEGQANFYFIKVDTSINKINIVGKSVASNALWLVNGRMTIAGTLKDWQNLRLLGSVPHTEFTELIVLHKAVQGKQNENDVLKQFVSVHPNSLYVSYLIIKMAPALQTEELAKIYNKLTELAKNSYWGLELAKKIKQNNEVNLLNTSGKIPDFNITDPAGKKTSIHEIASKAKYTLIDFWASWCSPCRAAIPKLSRVYDAFHAQGFNIIGISTDKKEADWRKAMSEDKTTWCHALDNIDYASKNIFGLAGIPGYILIDQNGKIIQTEIFTGSDNRLKIKQPEEKSLSGDLYEIVAKLLKEEKSK